MSPLRDLFLVRWWAELRRAVVVAIRDFLPWDAQRQLRFRVSLPHAVRNAIDCALPRMLMPGSDAAFAVEEWLPQDVQDRLNALVLPLTDTGSDAFFLNEEFEERSSVLDFPTLRDYDEHDHAFQETARLEQEPDYALRPYRGSLYHLSQRYGR